MLKVQQQSCRKYLEYLTQKIANEKAQHAKDIEIKEVQLQLLRKQLENGGTITPARASTPVRPPPLSSAFNYPIEEDMTNQEPTS